MTHIGVLKVLEEEDIPIRIVAGTSVGALIGAAYCSGSPLKNSKKSHIPFRFTTFARWTVSRYGFASNDRMVSFLTRTLKVKTFEELRIPLGVTATDFNTGEGVVFHSGSIIDPVRASCDLSWNVFCRSTFATAGWWMACSRTRCQRGLCVKWARNGCWRCI